MILVLVVTGWVMMDMLDGTIYVKNLEKVNPAQQNCKVSIKLSMLDDFSII